MIAEAASEIGLDDLTMKAVADRLGVSITGLYHHVDDKDDLLRIAAEHRSAQVPMPTDRGQHWAAWLFEWATASRDAFLADPGLLTQYLEGAISSEVVADKFDTALRVLGARGFAPRQAQAAFELVSSLVVGSALRAIQERRATAAGRALAAEHQRVLGERADADLPDLRRLLVDPAPRASFEDHLVTALVGVAVDRGEDPAPVRALAPTAPPRRRRPPSQGR
jgi:AcrR family transcriptional regulator